MRKFSEQYAKRYVGDSTEEMLGERSNKLNSIPPLLQVWNLLLRGQIRHSCRNQGKLYMLHALRSRLRCPNPYSYSHSLNNS
jgi:hypothetical protein